MKKILIQIHIFIESVLVFKEVLAGKRKSSVNHLTRLQSFKLVLPHKLYFVLAYWHDSLGNKMKKRHCWCCSYIYWLLYSLKIIAVKVLTDICQEGSKDPCLTGFQAQLSTKGKYSLLHVHKLSSYTFHPAAWRCFWGCLPSCSLWCYEFILNIIPFCSK